MNTVKTSKAKGLSTYAYDFKKGKKKNNKIWNDITPCV